MAKAIPFTIDYCLERAIEGERLALEAKQMGDAHAAYALRQGAQSWLEEALAIEAQS